MTIKKRSFIAILLVCSLVFGAIGAGAASKLKKITAYQNSAVKVTVDGKNFAIKDGKGKAVNPIQYNGTTYVPVNSVATALKKPISYDSKRSTFKIGKPPVSTKGILTLASNFNETKAKKDLRAEAIQLIKIYADEIVTGKTTKFNSYIDKSLYEVKDSIFTRKYTKDKYKAKLTAVRKANNADKRKKYSSALKKVNTSNIKMSYSYKGGASATFDYSFYPEGWTATSGVHASLGFTRLENGKYVLQSVNIN